MPWYLTGRWRVESIFHLKSVMFSIIIVHFSLSSFNFDKVSELQPDSGKSSVQCITVSMDTCSVVKTVIFNSTILFFLINLYCKCTLFIILLSFGAKFNLLSTDTYLKEKHPSYYIITNSEKLLGNSTHKLVRLIVESDSIDKTNHC